MGSIRMEQRLNLRDPRVIAFRPPACPSLLDNHAEPVRFTSNRMFASFGNVNRVGQFADPITKLTATVGGCLTTTRPLSDDSDGCWWK